MQMQMQNCNQYNNQPLGEDKGAWMNAGAVMRTGADGDGEENKITMDNLQQEWHLG